MFQVPDFGNRFRVYPIYDNRTNEIGRIGKQYGTKPGFYMIVGTELEGQGPCRDHGHSALFHESGVSHSAHSA